MKLYHVTPKDKVKSIAKDGIKPLHSKGKMQVCWFHTQSKLAWSLIHIAKHQKVCVNDMVAIELWIPRSWIRRKRRGIWTSKYEITPDMIRGIHHGVTLLEKTELPYQYKDN